LNLCVDRVQRKANFGYFRVGRRQHDRGFARLGQELTARLQLGAAAGNCIGQTEALPQARGAQRRIPGLPPQAFCLGAQYREGTALLFARLVLRLGSRQRPSQACLRFAHRFRLLDRGGNCRLLVQHRPGLVSAPCQRGSTLLGELAASSNSVASFQRTCSRSRSG
jgi:hypothetical protein